MTGNHGSSAHPWSFPVSVAKISASGSHVIFEADASQRAALAEMGSLRDVQSASAVFDLTLARGGAIQVHGRVRAVVGQDCVVTLEPISTTIDEEIDAVFAEADTGGAAVRPKTNDDDEEPDPPELIVNGVIDLGKLAADWFFLGIDPYPRKPDAVFQEDSPQNDPEDHPFAALKALKPSKS
jgi:uncharacterized metal-binding protein YceD (DUF177 family)